MSKLTNAIRGIARHSPGMAQGSRNRLFAIAHAIDRKQQAAADRIRYILRGIDQTETESPVGWWETSTGARMGAARLREVLEAVGTTHQPAVVLQPEGRGLMLAPQPTEGDDWICSQPGCGEIHRPRTTHQPDAVRDALTELVDLMQGVIDGSYTPDSFTLQPARAALAGTAHQPDAVLTNPWTGEPRDIRDVESDPAGILMVEPGKPLRAAFQQSSAPEFDPQPTVLTDDECDHIADFMERHDWTAIGKADVRLWAKAFDELPYLRAASQPSAADAQLTAEIDAAVKRGDISFDHMACDICEKPMVREETDYGPGWRFDCTCHDQPDEPDGNPDDLDGPEAQRRGI